MDGTDTGAGLHGDNGFHHHRHINNDAITLGDAQAFEAVGEQAHLTMQICVGDVVDFTPIGFKNQRDFVGVLRQMTVDTVVGDVQLTIGKPFEKRRIAVIKYLGERLVPGQQVTGQAAPVAGVILIGLIAQCVIGFHARDGGLLTESVGRRKAARFFQDGFDGGHSVAPL